MTKSENKEVLLKNKKYFIIKFIVSLLIRGSLLIIPLYYSYLIDKLTLGNYNAAYQMLIVFCILTVLYRLFEVINQKTYYALYSNLYKTYLELGFKKTCNNSIYSLSRFSLSEYSNIMSEDFETLSDYYATLVIRIVEILETIYIIIFFFTINIVIGYITLFISFIVLFILIFFNNKIANTNKIRKIKHDKRISLFQELLLSVKEIKGFNIFKVANNRTMLTINDYVKANNKLNIDKYNLKQLSLGLIDIFQIISLLIGIKLIIDGYTTIGVLTIIYNYYSKLNTLFTSIITLFESNINVKVAKLRVHKLFQYANNYEKDDYKSKTIGKIEFKNVLYGNKKNPTLDKVSFKIDANSLTLIVGVEGSGKSGIFDLLLRYNRQHQGSILIDNKDILIYNNTLSEIISGVTRNPTFFNISIKENLSIFDINFENIVYYAKLFNIHDYIMGLDDGYDTVLLTDASNINTDVKYVLAIIRVLLKRTKIMLFDEVFDFLSNDLSEIILDYLQNLKNDNTIIILSKSKNLLKNNFIDNIILIDHNKTLGSGTYQDLIKNEECEKILEKL